MPKPWEMYQQQYQPEAAPSTQGEQGPWSKYAESMPEEKGIMQSVSDFFTGEDRETQATRDLPELGQGGLLAGEDESIAAKVVPLLALTSDPQEQADILKSNYPDIGISYDEKGNIMASNSKTGARVVINKPGASSMDLINALGLGSAFALGGAGGGIVKAAAKDAAIETGIQTAQQAGGGDFDIQDVILAAGGAAAFKTVEELASVIYRNAKGKISPEQAKQIAESEMRGLKPTTSDVQPPTTAPGRFAQQVGEQTPVFGTAKAQESKQATRQDITEEFVSGYNPSYDDIAQSLRDKKDMVNAAAIKSRSNVVDQVANEQVTAGGTISAIDNEIQRLTTLPNGQPRQNVDQSTVNTLTDYKADIEADPSFTNMEQLRTTFRTDVIGDSIKPNTRTEGIAKSIYKSMTQDLDDVVKTNLSPREFGQWKKSNAVYGREAEKLKKSRLKVLFNKGDQVSSQDINKQILSKDEKVRRNLFASLNTKGRENARAAMISTFAENASKSGELSVNQFLSQLNKNKGQINDFFKGKDRQAIEGLRIALDATKRAQDSPVVTKSGMQAIPYVTAASALANLPATIGAAAGAGSISRIYESRPVRDALLRLSSVPKGSTQFEKALEKSLYAIIAGSQVLRSEVTE